MRAITDEDILIGYLMGEHDKLTKSQEKMLDRLAAFDDAIRQYGNRNKVIRLMHGKYKHEGQPYTMRQAQMDYQSCQYVFGSTYRQNKQYLLQILLDNISETRTVAKITKNATAMASCDKNLLTMIKEFFGDKDVPDYASLKIPDQVFTADPKALGMAQLPDDEKLMAELEKLRQLPQRKTIEIEYQEGDDE